VTRIHFADGIAQVPLQAIGLGCQRKKVYSSFDRTYAGDISCSNTEKKLTMGAPIMQELHWWLMSLLENRYTSSLTNRPCCKHLNQGQKPFNAGFSINDNGITLQLCRNASCSPLTVHVWTRPHLEKHCIIGWCLIFSPLCGPSATKSMNSVVVALKRCHRNCCGVELNVFWLIQMTEVLIVIDGVCEGSKYLKTSVSNGSKFPGRFRLRFRPRIQPLQWVLPYKNPDHCNWAGCTTKNPAFEHHKFGSN